MKNFSIAVFSFIKSQVVISWDEQPHNLSANHTFNHVICIFHSPRIEIEPENWHGNYLLKANHFVSFPSAHLLLERYPYHVLCKASNFFFTKSLIWLQRYSTYLVAKIQNWNKEFLLILTNYLQNKIIMLDGLRESETPNNFILNKTKKTNLIKTLIAYLLFSLEF